MSWLRSVAVDRRIERDVRLARVEIRHPLHGLVAESRDRPPVVQFAADVPEQALMARDHDLGGPPLRPNTEQFELDGKQRGVGLGLRDVRVHPVHVRGNDHRAAVVVVVHLLRHVAPVLEEAEADVALQFALAQHLGDGPGGLRPPYLELEEAVARGRVPLREEEVVLGLGVDVVDPPVVADDLDGCR